MLALRRSQVRGDVSQPGTYCGRHLKAHAAPRSIDAASEHSELTVQFAVIMTRARQAPLVKSVIPTRHIEISAPGCWRGICGFPCKATLLGEKGQADAQHEIDQPNIIASSSLVSSEIPDGQLQR